MRLVVNDLEAVEEDVATGSVTLDGVLLPAILIGVEGPGELPLSDCDLALDEVRTLAPWDDALPGGLTWDAELVVRAVVERQIDDSWDLRAGDLLLMVDADELPAGRLEPGQRVLLRCAGLMVCRG